MKHTDNFQMNKPEPTDYYDIDHFNDNIDIIDKELQANKEHRENQENPHGVNKKQLGLDKVDNTSDADKPVSTLQRQAIDKYKTADTVIGINPTATDSTDGDVIYLKNDGYTKKDGTPTPDNPIAIKGLGDSGTIEVKTSNEDYTQSIQALIPVSAPLYDGDCIEMFADGSGQIIRNKCKVVYDGSDDEIWMESISGDIRTFNMSLEKEADVSNNKNVVSSHFVSKTMDELNAGEQGILLSKYMLYFHTEDSITSHKEWLAWLQANPVTVVYELAAPTTEPLTAEQVAEFKKLQTFKDVTHINADGEVTVHYYCNNDSGETVSMVHDIANNPTPTFTEATTRQNIESGEKLSAIMGKIKKFFTDLKAVAFSGSYTDLSNKPTIPSLANNLTTTSSGMALDARQGKALNDKISTINSNLEKQELTITPIDNTITTVPKITIKNKTVKIYGEFNRNTAFGSMFNAQIAHLPSEIAPQESISFPCVLYGENYTFTSCYVSILLNGKIHLVTSANATNEHSVKVMITYDL